MTIHGLPSCAGDSAADSTPLPVASRRAWWLAGAALAVGIALTVLAGGHFRGREEADARDLAEHIAADVSANLARQVREYALLATKLAQSFPPEGADSLDDWNRSFSPLDLGKSIPGFRAVGFVERVTPAGLPDLDARLNDEWGSGVRVQAGGGQPRFHIVTLVAPAGAFPGLAGQDVTGDGPRIEAIERAIEDNRAVLTGARPAAPGGRDRDVAWVVFPVYRGGGAAATAAWRQEAARGVVFVAFDAQAALLATMGGLGGGRQAVLLDASQGAAMEVARQSGVQSRIVAHKEFNADGRRWKLMVGDVPTQHVASWAIFVTGTAISVLLALLVQHLLTRDALARRHARVLTASLQEREARLARTEDFLLRLIETMPVPVMVKDADFRYLIVNQAAGELLGAPAAELVGKAVADVLPTDFARRQTEQDARVLASGTTSVQEDKLVRPGLPPLPMLVRKSRLEGVDGAPVLVTVVTDLSDERRVQAELAQTHATTTALLAAIPDVLVQLDADLRIVSYHAGDPRDLTYPPERFLGRSIDDIFSPARATQYRRAARLARSDGEVQVIEYDSRDGERRPQDYEARIAPLTNGGFMVVTRRITERKCAERALQESEARWQFALEGAGDGIWDWDLQSRRLYRSKRWFALLGIERDAGWQTTDEWLELVHPDDVERTRAAQDALIRGTNDAYMNEYRARHQDGTWRWLLVRGKVMERDGAGRPQRVLGTTVDNSERRRAEWALRESEARFRRIADTAPVLIWMAAADGSLTYANKTWIDFFGGEADEDVRVWMTSRLHPDDRGATTWVPQGIPAAETFRREMRMRRGDGEYRWILVQGAPRLDEAGNLAGYIGTCTDISDQKRAEVDLRIHRDQLRAMVAEQTRDLIRAKEAAEAANEAKSLFLTNMSHELRTPLHAVISYARMGEEKFARMPPERLKGYFERIHDSGTRLLGLLNDLLDLAKLEAGRMDLEFRAVDLAAVVREAAREFEALMQSRHIALEVGAEPDLGRACGDPVRLGQVMRNLLSNAVKFSPDQSRVDVRLSRAELVLSDQAPPVPALRMVVADRGVGIPDGELESVFDKFVQSSKTRSGAGGTGLGLAICREIMTAHQGRILARHREGGGTEFEVLLPAVAADGGQGGRTKIAGARALGMTGIEGR